MTIISQKTQQTYTLWIETNILQTDTIFILNGKQNTNRYCQLDLQEWTNKRSTKMTWSKLREGIEGITEFHSLVSPSILSAWPVWNMLSIYRHTASWDRIWKCSTAPNIKCYRMERKEKKNHRKKLITWIE